MMNDKLNEDLNKTDNIIQNDKYDEFIAKIFTFFIIGYIFISWFFAILLLIYNFILVPLAQSLLPEDISTYNLSIQLINSLNVSPSESTFLLNNQNNTYQKAIQTLQSYTPILTNQLIKAELILIVPPAILLGLIYYSSKKENDDE